MSGIDPQIARHYDIGGLKERILAALAAAGTDLAWLSPRDLEPVDEFHIGGTAATAALLDQIGLRAGNRLLDVGSGIGGPARFAAARYQVRVSGIDLTPSHVEIASELSQMTGFGDEVDFVEGSALAMPFDDGTFDAAMILHVGMNIPDKPKLMGEVARVLKPQGTFAVYDIMRVGEGSIAYPQPWAATPPTSFVATPAAYREAAEAAGFAVKAEQVLGASARQFFATLRARAEAAQAEGKPPPLGIAQVMGDDAKAKIANLVAAIEADMLAPVEMILRRA